MKKLTKITLSLLLASSAAMADSAFLEYEKVNKINPDFLINANYLTSSNENTKFSNVNGGSIDFKYKVGEHNCFAAATYIGIYGEYVSGEENDKTRPEYLSTTGKFTLTQAWNTETQNTSLILSIGKTRVKDYENNSFIDYEYPFFAIGTSYSFQMAKSDLWTGLDLEYKYGREDKIKVDGVDTTFSKNINGYKIGVPFELKTSMNYSFIVKYEYDWNKNSSLTMHQNKIFAGLKAKF